MASKPGKEVTVEVKNNNGRSRSKSRTRSQSRGRDKSVKITVNSKPKGRGRRGRNTRQSAQRVANIVNKQLRKSGVTGPKPAITQKAVATLGTVGANTSNGTELEASIFLNPVLVKDSSGSNAFGPLQALGAQYSMWKLNYCVVKLTPMVGQSAVSGTVARISLNPTATPSSTSWSGLGARYHIDAVVGKPVTFKLKPAQLGGPREGWWLTNTNDNAQDTLGPSIEVHTFGQTQRTYQTGAYDGPLFLLELSASWAFSGYSANPSLVNLEKDTDSNVAVTFAGSAGNPLTMEVPVGSLFAQRTAARSVQPSEYARASGTSTSETVWQVVGTAVDVISAAIPPPFGWLIKGGWWFVKQVAGAPRSGTRRYYVYASYQDALTNKPAICTGGRADGRSTRSTVQTALQFTQMNEPSTGIGQTVVTLGRAIPDNNTQWKLVFNPANVGPNTPNSGIYLAGTYETHTLDIGINRASAFSRVHLIVKVNAPKLFNEEWEPLPNPTPIPGLRLYGGETHVGDVLLRAQVRGPDGADAFTATAYLVTMGRDLVPRTSSLFRLVKADANSWMQTNNGTGAADWSLSRGVWYIMLSFSGATSTGWHWSNANLTNGMKIYSTVFSQLYNPVPRIYTMMLEMVGGPIPSLLKENEEVGEQEVEDLEFELARQHNAISDEERWCDTCDAAEPPPSEEEDVSEEETDSETESDEDEIDEVDRFDLHDSSGSEPEDDDVENSRVTLLNTLVNQGMDILRAAKISKRAYPTHSEKIKRSVYMDCLATGCSPASAWSEACKAARRATKSQEPQISESRGHAE
ncbi:MAG: capsid protein precursor [Raccoon dog astrovirus 1]|nr:MAG: capsid protein precursor [Raccoon dog astrovirus 1]ULF47964.1 MAG: capsid protein precursor [Raccoon dog astrovirus 1]